MNTITGVINAKLLLVGLAALFVLSGCVSGLGGDTYSRNEARKVVKIQEAVVVEVRDVQIEGTKSGIGKTLGAIAGAVNGAYASNSVRTSSVLSVLGAAFGGLLGASAEEAITRRDGVEVTLRGEDGNLFSVVQEKNASDSFKPGDRVRVGSYGRVLRVNK